MCDWGHGRARPVRRGAGRRLRRRPPQLTERPPIRLCAGFMGEPTYTVKALDESTWDAFAALVERNNGVFGGCWCMGFHPEGVGKETTAEQNRERKLERVRAGTAHAALVFDGDDCVGWCQFGAPGEVPRIKSRAAYEKGVTTLPDWRIACNFVGKGHRRQGVATAALAGAIELIATLGSGDCRGLSGGRRLGARGLPLQRRTVHLRDVRVRPRPENRQAPLGRDEGGRAGVVGQPARWPFTSQVQHSTTLPSGSLT